MSAPLRIGLLGASRIAEDAITKASHDSGEIRAAVAARDLKRAEAYAFEHGYEKAYEGYDALLADDSIDLIYNGLPNAMHAEWTVRALDAGRSVLLEKPFASNLAEFDLVAKRLETAPGWVWEAFHYADHPAIQRLIEVVQGGEIGELREVDVHMNMPSPEPDDPRWNFELAGGTVMDVGCYASHSLLLLGDALGLSLELDAAKAEPYDGDGRVDARMTAELTLGGAAVSLQASMLHDETDFSLRVIGSAGDAFLPNFVKPQWDDRLLVNGAEGERVERMGTTESYVYQLQRIRQALRTGERSQQELSRSRRNMELIDQMYQLTGLPLRPARLV
ncbi:MAG: Gfo/Idh/MocA family protein [Leucobacter sp.]